MLPFYLVLTEHNTHRLIKLSVLAFLSLRVQILLFPLLTPPDSPLSLSQPTFSVSRSLSRSLSLSLLLIPSLLSPSLCLARYLPPFLFPSPLSPSSLFVLFCLFLTHSFCFTPPLLSPCLCLSRSHARTRARARAFSLS
jgi:hypothetical protein